MHECHKQINHIHCTVSTNMLDDVTIIERTYLKHSWHFLGDICPCTFSWCPSNCSFVMLRANIITRTGVSCLVSRSTAELITVVCCETKAGLFSVMHFYVIVKIRQHHCVCIMNHGCFHCRSVTMLSYG